jgi:hypothetical protein
MDADDAWSTEIKRLFATPDPDPLALDQVTAERLLTGDLPPDQTPLGYAEVAALLAATVAAKPGRAGRPGGGGGRTAGGDLGPSGQYSEGWRVGPAAVVGLVVAVAVGALSTGGIAAAATGHLPDPIREAAGSRFGVTKDTPGR